MLSVKRLLQLIAIALFIGIAYLFFTVDHNTGNASTVNNYAREKINLTTNALPTITNFENYLIVGNSKVSTQKFIKDNIVENLASMKKNYKLIDRLSENDLAIKPILIFSDTQISNCADMGLVSNYISTGGKVLFAAGLPEGYLDSYMNPVWGIVEKGNLVTANNFKINDDFFAYSGETVDFSGNNVSTSIRLGPNTSVYVMATNDIPIVYSNSFNRVQTVIINGNLLKEKYSSGILCGALGVLEGDFIYPVLGTKTIFLDCFPPIANIDDVQSTKLYGRSVESFLNDILWPQLMAKMLNDGLKYTASILTVLPGEYDTKNINKRLFTSIFRDIVSRNPEGEIIISGDHSKPNKNIISQATQAHTYFRSVFKNYMINAYSVLYGKPDIATLKSISSVFDNLAIINGPLNGDPNTQFTKDFSMSDGFVYVPTVSSGFSVNNGSFFDFLSAETSKGVVSHSFNIESLLKAPDAQSGWDGLKQSFESLSALYFEKTPWLTPSTITETANKVIAFTSLKTEVSLEARTINVYCDNFLSGQAFYLRTNKTVKEVKGGSFTKISNAFYMIKASSPSFTVVFA